MIPRPALLCDDESCLCRGTGIFDLDQLQADGAQESPPRLRGSAPRSRGRLSNWIDYGRALNGLPSLPSIDDELALRYRDGDR